MFIRFTKDYKFKTINGFLTIPRGTYVQGSRASNQDIFFEYNGNYFKLPSDGRILFRNEMELKAYKSIELSICMDLLNQSYGIWFEPEKNRWEMFGLNSLTMLEDEMRSINKEKPIDNEAYDFPSGEENTNIISVPQMMLLDSYQNMNALSGYVESHKKFYVVYSDGKLFPKLYNVKKEVEAKLLQAMKEYMEENLLIDWDSSVTRGLLLLKAIA